MKIELYYYKYFYFNYFFSIFFNFHFSFKIYYIDCLEHILFIFIYYFIFKISLNLLHNIKLI